MLAEDVKIIGGLKLAAPEENGLKDCAEVTSLSWAQVVLQEKAHAKAACDDLRRLLAADPMTFAKLLGLSLGQLAIADASIAKILEAAPAQGVTISCTGCRAGSCCTIPVSVGVCGSVAIASYLESLGRLKGMLPVLEARHREQSAGTQDEWFSHTIPCLFLDARLCAIYPYRPFTCRAYFVSSPPEDCAKVGTVNLLDTSILQLRAAPVEAALREVLGLSYLTTTLPGGVWAIGRNLWCKDNFAAFRKRVQRDWASVEVVNQGYNSPIADMIVGARGGRMV